MTDKGFIGTVVNREGDLIFFCFLSGRKLEIRVKLVESALGEIKLNRAIKSSNELDLTMPNC